MNERTECFFLSQCSFFWKGAILTILPAFEQQQWRQIIGHRCETVIFFLRPHARWVRDPRSNLAGDYNARADDRLKMALSRNYKNPRYEYNPEYTCLYSPRVSIFINRNYGLQPFALLTFFLIFSSICVLLFYYFTWMLLKWEKV
jgi:hypothetical protein